LNTSLLLGVGVEVADRLLAAAVLEALEQQPVFLSAKAQHTRSL
jgi:hypothetical protein